LRNGDIPQYLKDGVVDAAIIGGNILVEKGDGIASELDLGFSRCRVALAVPKSMVYKNINDLNGLKIAQKVGEEAIETVIEAKDSNDSLFLEESADLLFHFLILLQAKKYRLLDVVKVLKSRH